MDVVWKAEDTVLGHTVAIRVLPADVAHDEQRRQLFLKPSTDNSMRADRRAASRGNRWTAKAASPRVVAVVGDARFGAHEVAGGRAESTRCSSAGRMPRYVRINTRVRSTAPHTGTA